MTDLLVARKVRKEFGGLVACNDVDFNVPERGIVSLIGPNGAGKTTFFNMLTGAYTPTSGEVTFDGTEIAGLPPHRVTELGIGRTFQNIRLFQTMSSLENVMVGMHCRTKGGVVRSILRTPGIRREERESRAKARRDPPLRRARPGGGRGLRDEPVLRRPAPARGGPGAGHRAQAGAAGRADRRHEPAGEPATSPRSCPVCATSGI